MASSYNLYKFDFTSSLSVLKKLMKLSIDPYRTLTKFRTCAKEDRDYDLCKRHLFSALLLSSNPLFIYEFYSRINKLPSYLRNNLEFVP